MVFLDSCIVIGYINGNLLMDDVAKKNLAMALINKYTLSLNMTIYATIIAVTCMIYDLPLWTYNKRDFKYLKQVKFAQ